MVGLAKWIVGTPRERADPSVVAEIFSIRNELDGLTLEATARCDALRERIKALAPSHAREVLLASVLRLLQNLEAEAEERQRALARCGQ